MLGSPRTLCSLNCIISTIQVTEGRKYFLRRLHAAYGSHDGQPWFRSSYVTSSLGLTLDDQSCQSIYARSLQVI